MQSKHPSIRPLGKQRKGAMCPILAFFVNLFDGEEERGFAEIRHILSKGKTARSSIKRLSLTCPPNAERILASTSVCLFRDVPDVVLFTNPTDLEACCSGQAPSRKIDR